MNLFEFTSAGLSALMALLWIWSPVSAQQNTADSDTSRILELDEIIISASRYEQSPESVGRNVTVISQEEIQNSIFTNVSEILGQQQSIHMVGAHQTPGSLQQGFIRNANSNHSIVMIDGVRISDPSTTNNGIDLSELSLTGIQRIEIVRGSHSTLYGSSAIGGVVNIITQDEGAEGFNVDIETEHGQFGDNSYSTNNSLSTNYTSESGIYANFGIDQRYTSGVDATVDTTTGSGFNPQDKDGFRKLDLHGKLGYSGSYFDIYGAYRNADQHIELDQGAFEDDDNAKQDYERDLFNYGISSDLGDQITLEFEGGYSTLKRDFVNDSSLVSSDGTYDGTYTETNGEGTLLENELKAVHEGEYIDFVVGVSASKQTMNTRTYTYSRSQFGVFENTTDLDSLNLNEIIYNGYVHANLNGGLLSDNFEPFSLVLGTRFIEHGEFGSHFTYEINPKLQVSESALVYGAITTGFNAPSLYQLHSPNEGFGAHTNRGNSGLEPEESVSYEVGWKQDISDLVRFNLSLFRTDVENVIEYIYLWNGDTLLSNLSGSDYLGDTYINIANQQVNGVELGVEVQAVSNLSFSGNVSYTDSKSTFEPGDIDESYTGGNHVQIFESGVFVDEEQQVDGLTRRPNISANIKIDYLPTSKWKIGLSSQFVGDRDDIFYSADLGPFGALDRSEVGNYNVTNVSLQYRINNNIRLMGKVENIFNTEYQQIRGYNTRGRGGFIKARISF